MSEEPTGVPVTWRELRESGMSQGFLDQVRALPQALSAKVANPVRDLGLRAPALAGVLVLTDATPLRPVVEGVGPQIEYARKAQEVNPGGDTPGVRLRLLSSFNALECGGLVNAPFAGADAGAMLERLAGEAKDLSEPQGHTAGLAAVAAGKTKLVSKFVGGGKLPAKFTPGETFLFNVTGFIRYLAVATDKGATAADVQPAWHDFVRAFPRKLAAETLDWPDLLWAGRIYYHGFEKRPAGEVAGAIRELVSSL